MSTRKHDTSHMHDRSRGMVREKSRARYMEEKKEMEHELSNHREEITKLLNEDFRHFETSRYRGQYVVKFQHPDTKRIQKLTFHFEPNFSELEPMWTDSQHH